ncbi:MAG TPA: M28 family peptidase [Vicinamibacterales bacterium]|nr:M28 family peptidase [Vicinamibacterales bacterium]
MRARAILVLLAAGAALGGCSRAAVVFSEQNARAHVGMLAGTIGSRPVGTAANARARDYIVDQLRVFGFEVRVQEADARRPELGVTGRVTNVIGIKPGARPEAIGLLSHYDSSPDAPGAADDALGVAVSLEAARVLAARPEGTWSLMVLVTDGEEAGLLGAAALVTDHEVTSRLHAYLNVEAVGSSGPAVLFEVGPGNGWLVGPWTRAAPHPSGASFGIEIYRRLPNDTDFSILKRREIPGLNFAATGDSYAYHTARDTPERLSQRTIRTTGENLVAIVSALEEADITRRSPWLPTYFDLGGTLAVSYGPVIAWMTGALALLTGGIAMVRSVAAALRIGGVGRWLFTGFWAVTGSLAVLGSMIGTTWLLRAARETFHPWYARPDRLFLLLLVVGVAVGWGAGRVGQWLPARIHGLRHPVVAWSITLPVWVVLAALTSWAAPGAAFLWVLPLLAAGVLFSLLPLASVTAVRLASILVFAVCAMLWLRPTIDMLRFTVAVFGRLPVVTPVFVYAALMAAAGVMIVPPLTAALATSRPLLRPMLMTAVLLLAVSAASGFAYGAPAYTSEQPLRRVIRVIQDHADPEASWEVASVEPGLDLLPGSPRGWTPADAAPATSAPRSKLPFPFVFRTKALSPGDAPVAIAEAAIGPLAEGSELSLAVVPREPGLTVAFVLPEGLTPARSNLPGLRRQGRWTATYLAAPPPGVRLRASFARADPARLREARIAVTSPRIPGGDGWQSLPTWLPQDLAVWSASMTWILDPFDGPGIAPVPPLR